MCETPDDQSMKRLTNSQNKGKKKKKKKKKKNFHIKNFQIWLKLVGLL